MSDYTKKLEGKEKDDYIASHFKDPGIEIVKGVNGWFIEKGERRFERVFNDHLEAFSFYRNNKELVLSRIG